MLSELIKSSQNGILDYGLLMSILSHYREPLVVVSSKTVARMERSENPGKSEYISPAQDSRFALSGLH